MMTSVKDSLGTSLSERTCRILICCLSFFVYVSVCLSLRQDVELYIRGKYVDRRFIRMPSDEELKLKIRALCVAQKRLSDSSEPQTRQATQHTHPQKTQPPSGASGQCDTSLVSGKGLYFLAFTSRINWQTWMTDDGCFAASRTCRDVGTKSKSNARLLNQSILDFAEFFS